MASPSPSLKDPDPAQAWQPWRPTSADPWSRKWAAHLYRRAAFGASHVELLEAERLGPEKTLDLLLHGKAGAGDLDQTLDDTGEEAARHDDSGDDVRAWWLYVMFQTGQPLREKMTVFWHNHFATSIAKIDSVRSMFRQNRLLRTHALGRFGPMLQAISRDPAMLIWLDSNSNVKGRANENYARELMELFTLGVGHYTEHDVREGARAFTGWHTDGERFQFNPAEHDGGVKKFLNQTGPWDGADVVRIVLQQPAAARFLARKLYHFLVSETAEPTDALLEPLCVAFRKSDFDVAALLRTMLLSRHFYSAHSFRQRIKSPVEYVVGAVRAVYRNYAEADPEFRPLPPRVLVPWVTGMGQVLFAPPNVKGWPGARAWLNTSTVLVRDNFAEALASGSLWAESQASPGTPPNAFDPARLVDEDRGRRPEDIVDSLLNLYVPGGARPAARARLTAYVAQGQPSGSVLKARVRQAVHAILTMPEYQLA